jgi:hypothetical protein
MLESSGAYGSAAVNGAGSRVSAFDRKANGYSCSMHESPGFRFRAARGASVDGFRIVSIGNT